MKPKEKLYVVFSNFITLDDNEHNVIGVFSDEETAMRVAKKEFDGIISDKNCWEYDAANRIREKGDGEYGCFSNDIDLDDTELRNCYQIEDTNNYNCTSVMVFETEFVK